jgi:hypothetical protein
MDRKLLLAVVMFSCMAPAAFAGARNQEARNQEGCNPRKRCQPVQVPEGGSAAIYLLGAGLTCFGAMFLRSMVGKSVQS